MLGSNHHVLLAQRYRDLRRQRTALLARRDELRRPLPAWAALPLRLAGLAAAEVADAELDAAERRTALVAVEAELEQLDRRLRELERELIAAPSAGLDGVTAMLRLALDQLHRQAPADADDSSALRFLERASRDLGDLAQEDYRAAG